MAARVIEALLRAVNEAGADAGPEELADILWLAGRVGPAAGSPEPEAPPPAAGPAAPPPPRRPSTATAAAAGTRARLFPASDPDPGPAEDEAGAGRGDPVRVPRPPTLRDPLAVMRSLRPVGRRARGGPDAERELDEELTVARSVELLLPTPVLRPARSRWLDLALVVDTHHSMLLWQDLVAELRRVITQTGVFRDVRLWYLDGTGADGLPAVTHRRGAAPRRPQEIADPSGHRLILVVTDTVGGGWAGGPLHEALRHWSCHNPVAVLNVLPERLWSRGAARPSPRLLRASRPAAANASWQQAPTSPRARARRRPDPAAAWLPVPVVDPSPAALTRLADLVAGDSRWQRMACLLLDTAVEQSSSPAADPEALPAGPALERFRETSSVTAQHLAGYLSAVPLTLPVMTLVRRAMLPDSDHGHLAEVALSGLLRPWDDHTGGTDPERMEFAFLPGVREALLGSQLRHQISTVRELVPESVWRYLSRQPRTTAEFGATRVDPAQPSGDGARTVAAGRLPFAAKPGTVDLDESRAGTAWEHRGWRIVSWLTRGVDRLPTTGVLLTPRTFLTPSIPNRREGDGPSVVWDGSRWVACHTVWGRFGGGFGAALVRAETDLVDPVAWARSAPPLRWGDVAEGSRVRDCQVPCTTEVGDPATAEGTLISTGGRLYFEPSGPPGPTVDWSELRGAPVFHGDVLMGCLVGEATWPQRWRVQPIGPLLSEESFLVCLDDTSGARPERERVPVPTEGDSLCIALQLSLLGGPGSGVHLSVLDGSNGERWLRRLLLDTMEEAGVDGVVTTPRRTADDTADLVVGLSGTDSLRHTGVILTALGEGLARRTVWTGGERRLTLALAISSGPVAEAPDGLTGPAVAAAVRMVGHASVLSEVRAKLPLPSSLSATSVLVVSPAVREAIQAALGPDPSGDFHPVVEGDDDRSRGAAGAYSFLGDIAALGRALTSPADAPGWPHCGFDASPEDPAGCRGIRVPGHQRCLVHLTGAERSAYLSGLHPGDDVDASGTPFTAEVLNELLAALWDGRLRRARFGRAEFTEALFMEGAPFRGVRFTDVVLFDRATFHEGIDFTLADFSGGARFRDATFHGPTMFSRATFGATAEFDRATFHGATGFQDTVFAGPVSLRHTTFHGDTYFDDAAFLKVAAFGFMTVHGRTRFRRAVFQDDTTLTHTTFHGPVSFRHAVFEGIADLSHSTFHAGCELPTEPAAPTLVSVSDDRPADAERSADDLHRWLDAEPTLRGRLRRAVEAAPMAEMGLAAGGLLAALAPPAALPVLAGAVLTWLQTRRTRQPSVTITRPDGTAVTVSGELASTLDEAQRAELIQRITGRLEAAPAAEDGASTDQEDDRPPEPPRP
ncbi:pentapeptide repeat-containing protein [Streptomyces sp. LX-29]|uniref:effector-associated constant component EACC1 n=1 Tax=Streptomyces sp. LX-29 TaxID=2900152 RepID=UPI00240DC356|nr:SAV_2336 N-terminal domain-related protein [Streptomyces sp. LX-29]WFB10680.1 pentapeptide repeat-containing protein [Streptomyces sp. LX-29]